MYPGKFSVDLDGLLALPLLSPALIVSRGGAGAAGLRRDDAETERPSCTPLAPSVRSIRSARARESAAGPVRGRPFPPPLPPPVLCSRCGGSDACCAFTARRPEPILTAGPAPCPHAGDSSRSLPSEPRADVSCWGSPKHRCGWTHPLCCCCCCCCQCICCCAIHCACCICCAQCACCACAHCAFCIHCACAHAGGGAAGSCSPGLGGCQACPAAAPAPAADGGPYCRVELAAERRRGGGWLTSPGLAEQVFATARRSLMPNEPPAAEGTPSPANEGTDDRRPS
mmetsp:Transcript_3279/g.10130  ORF Transcript_3279/g.10130 Transcript_3279/m.10130 type:complete len:284 (+) Transcript_3279:807-1658(+)